jgi:hypothetical protein
MPVKPHPERMAPLRDKPASNQVPQIGLSLTQGVITPGKPHPEQMAPLHDKPASSQVPEIGLSEWLLVRISQPVIRYCNEMIF